MKKFITLIITIGVALLFTGCGAVQPQIGTGNHNIIKMKKEEMYENKTINILISVKADAQPIEKLATMIERAAIEFNKAGVKYFNINEKFFIMDKIPNGIIPFLTDIESVNKYCFPEGGGLEQKCKPLTGTLVKLSIIESDKNKNIFTTPNWSVEEVLNDPNIKKYSNSFKEEQVVQLDPNKLGFNDLLK